MTRKGDIFVDILLIVGLLALFIGGTFYVRSSREVQPVGKYHIVIKDSLEVQFVTTDSVRVWIDKVVGAKPKDVDLDVSAIEEFIASKRHVSKVDVYKNTKGELWVNITQKVPVIRILSDAGNSVYLDTLKQRVDMSTDYSCDVPLVTCSDSLFNLLVNMNDSLNRAEKQRKIEGKDRGLFAKRKNVEKNIAKNYIFLDNLINFVKLVRSDDLWNSQTAQINIARNGDVELVPRVGSQIIILCTREDLSLGAEYLHKLRLFYSSQMNKIGWNRYKTINLKYRSLIVCTN